MTIIQRDRVTSNNEKGKNIEHIIVDYDGTSIATLACRFNGNLSAIIASALHGISVFVATSLMLTAIAQAGTDHGKGNGGENNGNQWGKDKGDAPATSTPEPNTAIVLITFLGAVLVVGAMHLWRRQKNTSEAAALEMNPLPRFRFPSISCQKWFISVHF